jgi:hypothetical protein
MGSSGRKRPIKHPGKVGASASQAEQKKMRRSVGGRRSTCISLSGSREGRGNLFLLEMARML